MDFTSDPLTNPHAFIAHFHAPNHLLARYREEFPFFPEDRPLVVQVNAHAHLLFF
jgi:hypothetical protein